MASRRRPGLVVLRCWGRLVGRVPLTRRALSVGAREQLAVAPRLLLLLRLCRPRSPLAQLALALLAAHRASSMPCRPCGRRLPSGRGCRRPEGPRRRGDCGDLTVTRVPRCPRMRRRRARRNPTPRRRSRPGLDIDRAVAAGMLDRPFKLNAELAQARAGRVQPARRHRQREVDVTAAFVTELLLARRPQTESRSRPAREPGAVILTRERLQSERRRIERLERRPVARLERHLADPLHPGTSGLSSN